MSQQTFYQVTAPFEAARKISSLPSDHPASRLHGHSFQAKLTASLPSDWASFQGAEIDDLQALLKKTTKPLDYAYLNDLIAIPTDENLARWIRDNINFSIDQLGVQRTPNPGADIAHQGHVHLWRRFQFEAAQCLPNVPKEHPCGSMHGHSFEVVVHVEQPLEGVDRRIDYDWLTRIWQCRDVLDVLSVTLSLILDVNAFPIQLSADLACPRPGQKQVPPTKPSPETYTPDRPCQVQTRTSQA